MLISRRWISWVICAYLLFVLLFLYFFRLWLEFLIIYFKDRSFSLSAILRALEFVHLTSEYDFLLETLVGTGVLVEGELSEGGIPSKAAINSFLVIEVINPLEDDDDVDLF